MPSTADSRDPFLTTRGSQLTDQTGTQVRMRGVGLGGWMNMENFITGYPYTETAMRQAVRDVLGPERYEAFFDRLLEVFFGPDDAAYLAQLGLNSVRVPVNYRHFEDDRAPFEIMESGFRRLDRVIETCAAAGIYTVIDLHALPGYQNHHWHSDNPTHLPAFWDHRHFQDRVVNLWEHIADRYKDNPWVAGYNPINEPADESGEVIGPFCRRLVGAIRAIDPHHLVFLDGNSYSREFDVFGEPMDGVIYTAHDYALAGFVWGGPYPGETQGTWVDKDYLEKKFLDRTEYQRRTGTPIWVGEFGPVYTGDPERDEQRYRILTDQLEIYQRYEASWSIWTYKDIGLQGLVHTDPSSAYMQRFAGHLEKKARLGADAWGSTDEGVREAMAPLQKLVAREFPDFDPYPNGAEAYVNLLVRHILLSYPLAREYAEHFRGLSEQELDALADSFAFARCQRRERLAQILEQHG
jgi:endoglucanase